MENIQTENKHKCSMEEYSALRSEIVSHLEQLRNTWIAMITLYVTLFVLAIETKSMYLLLTTYIILIPFQYTINSQRWSIHKISTYIYYFYEKENTGIHWESMHSFNPYQKYYKRYGDEKVANIRIPILLGIFASLYFIGYNMYTSYIENIYIDRLTIVLMIVSIVLLFWLWTVNLNYNKSYEDKIEQIVLEYKKHICEMEIKNDEEKIN